jgi:geranylgeranyl reductase family protein
MRYDVIIIGAGPAGSTSARHCAAAGLSALLLDRERFPRAKPCGGALSARARDILGVILPDELIEQACYGARIRFGTQSVECRKQRPIAYMIDRSRFDHFLAGEAVRAGTEFRERETVTEVRQDGRSAVVTTPGGIYEAQYAIVADGVNSMFARQVRPALGRDELMAAMTTTVARTRSVQDDRDDLLEMHFGIAPLGYGWVFPHGDRLSIGIMGLASHLSGAPQRFRAYCRSVGFPDAGMRGHMIPLGGMARPIASGRVLLVGDAAGFADPFQGEGLVHAIRSGQLAAEAVSKAIRTGTHAGQEYARNAGREISRDLKVALQMAWMLERHPKLFLAIFFQHTRAIGKYLDIAVGESSYRLFRRWLLPRLPSYLLR